MKEHCIIIRTTFSGNVEYKQEVPRCCFSKDVTSRSRGTYMGRLLVFVSLYISRLSRSVFVHLLVHPLLYISVRRRASVCPFVSIPSLSSFVCPLTKDPLCALQLVTGTTCFGEHCFSFC